MRERLKKPNMGGLLALLLLGVFAVCILSVLLMGADAYQRIVQRDSASYDRRTAAQYIATRVRQADAAGGVSVRAFEGRDALVLWEEADGVLYRTMVYYHDGYLRELFVAEDSVFGEDGYAVSPDDGEKILEARQLQVLRDEPVENMLRVVITAADDQRQELWLMLRSGGEAAS